MNPTVQGLGEEIMKVDGKGYLSIPRAQDKDFYPLSSAQKRMYLLHMTEPDKTVYNMPYVFRLKGSIDTAKLEAAFQTMIDRHEILRTVFVIKDGEPVQNILPEAKGIFTKVNSSNPVNELLNDFVKEFDLSQAPLMRVQLVEHEKESYLLLDMHHIISDGASMDTFMKEVTIVYGCETLKSLTHQYKDYSQWVQERDLSKEREYWLEIFKDEVPVLDMPLDFTRPKEKSNKGATVEHKMDSELKRRVETIAKTHRTTEYMVYLSVLMILLGKYSRKEDVVIGSPVNGRIHKDTESILGMFVNTLAMRGYPNHEKTYASFLEEVRNICMKAYQNQEYPFEELVKELHVIRDYAHNPLFDVMLVYEQDIQGKIIFGGVEAKSVSLERDVAKFDLTFIICEHVRENDLAIEYCTDLFREDSAKRMLSHYIEILEQVTQDSGILIGDIGVITEEEKELVLGAFNDTVVEYPKDKTVIELFEEQVTSVPEQTALIFGEESMSYRELNSKINQLARKLRGMGVKPDDIVPIMAERSIEMIIGILGIMKAGGAYLPIDATFPEERIAYMLEDSKAKLVLKYKTEVNTQLPVVDIGDATIYMGDDSNLEKVNVPDDLIYCIYTSGTTGNPKGVLIENHGIVSLNKYFLRNYGLTQKDKILQFANQIFDASVWETMMALLNGATLVVVPKEVQVDSDAIGIYCKRHQVTVALFPPNYYLQINDIKLRILMTAGSESNVQIVEKARDSQYINAYGPTESTICATDWKYKKGEVIPSNIPIGKPIANSQVYIMEGMQLCGIGIIGELCIGGVGIARGYLNRPELTAERFIDNPWEEGRLYRTGDLARWLPDGNIEFWGRKDDQVKIRGYRIELGEIESAIRKLNRVKDVAVISREYGKGEKVICGYVLMNGQLNIGEMREELGKILPDYMIPRYLMQISSIPMTHNGKLDKKALPEIEVKSEHGYVAPRNEIEEQLCRIFSEVLGIKQVGIYDNFFELGGDSIKAMRVTAKLRSVGYAMSIKDVLVGRTINVIAHTLKKIDQEQYEQGEVSGVIQTTPILKAFNEWNLKKPNHFNQAVIIKTKTDDIIIIEKALDALVNHHDMLRATYQNGRLEILEDKRERFYDFYVIDINHEADINKKIIMENTKLQSNIDLVNGPLMVAALYITQNGLYLFTCIHHLVVDGVSWHILLEDFRLAEEQLTSGKNICLPLKTASFKKWAEALEEYKQQKCLQDEKEYWKAIISKMEKRSENLCKVNRCEEFGCIDFNLNEEKTEKLLQNANRAYNTEINDLLISSLVQTIGHFTKKKYVSIQMEAHGREEIHKKIAIEHTVGWFTSMYPICMEYKEDIKDSIISTKEYFRKVPNHGIGYGLLSEDLPKFQSEILFNYLGEMDVEEKNCRLDDLLCGISISPENRLPSSISINCCVKKNKFQLEINYDQSRYDSKTIVELAALYKEILTKTIELCVSQKEQIKTISDFSADKLTSIELDELQTIFS
jgi:amino acid adenylation domain-containing protein/non-ribosomal peptide synthase protein (TIGR01720 family)